jgi:hypothetical protein
MRDFVPNADLDAARQLAENFSVGGVIVKSLGKDILASLETKCLPDAVYDKLARLCHNKNIDNKRNVIAARELSCILFGVVIQPLK